MNPNCVVVSVAGTVTLLIVRLPHVLNPPSAKSFSVAVSDVDDRVSARNAEMHAELPDTPSSRDAFNPPSKNAPFAKFGVAVVPPPFSRYRHGAGVLALLSIAHARSPAAADAQSAAAELNSSCSGPFPLHPGAVRNTSAFPLLPPTQIRITIVDTDPPLLKSLTTNRSPGVVTVPFAATTPAVCGALNPPDVVPVSPIGFTKNQNPNAASPLVSNRSTPK